MVNISKGRSVRQRKRKWYLLLPTILLIFAILIVAQFDIREKTLLSSFNYEYSLQNTLTKVKARNAYLYTHNTDKSQWGWKTGGPPKFQQVSITKAQTLYTALQPTISCPWKLQRSNYVSDTAPPQFDGGKWTCGLNQIEKCIVYSFGSNGDDFFERNIIKVNPSCEIHIFDPTSGTPPQEWNDKYHFHPIGICPNGQSEFSLEGTNTKTQGQAQKTYPCRSIQQLMQQLGHEKIDILKADVEGMEWELLPDLWKLSVHNVGQLLFEFHLWHEKSPKYLQNILREYIIPLEKMGYFVHTLEPVAAEIEAYEVTFLNVNWDPKFGIATDDDKKMFDVSMYPKTPNVEI